MKVHRSRVGCEACLSLRSIIVLDTHLRSYQGLSKGSPIKENFPSLNSAVEKDGLCSSPQSRSCIFPYLDNQLLTIQHFGGDGS